MMLVARAGHRYRNGRNAQALRGLDPAIALSNVKTMDERFARARPRRVC